MTDLFVLVADADMEAVFRSVLGRPDALGIRPVSFLVRRHPNRDSGVFKDGPELLRAIPKGDYDRFLVAFDHHGSGCNMHPDDCVRIIQDRLDSFTFKDRSMAVMIAPELEAWLWRDPPAIAATLEVGTVHDPKDQLRQVFVNLRRRQPRPQDFEQIATVADLARWESSPSFLTFKLGLQNWFPRA